MASSLPLSWIDACPRGLYPPGRSSAKQLGPVTGERQRGGAGVTRAGMTDGGPSAPGHLFLIKDCQSVRRAGVN